MQQMSIALLPDKTIRTLTSSQALLSPVSIVKELIDNAIDGGATQINVEIDNTTCERIQVKDNGSGVRDGTDREMMCMPHTTSKITRLEDLDSVVTLGFRGEALSSLVQVAGTVEITTRCTTDSVGQTWTVSRAGVRLDWKNVAASVGTTVTATKLYSDLPVRQLIYVKAAKKTTAQIRQLLTAYALSRRHLRVTFKIPKSVAPVTFYDGGSSLKEAVIANIGRTIATNSQFITKSVDGWTFTAVLPSSSGSDSGNSELKQAVYVIDNRVLANLLGTAKKLAKITSKNVRSEHKGLVYLNISTPDEPSYDVNIEPGKDDVLLYREDWVLQQWEIIVTEFYMPSSIAGSIHPQETILDNMRQETDEPEIIPVAIEDVNDETEDSGWMRSMYDESDLQEDTDDTSEAEAEDDNIETDKTDYRTDVTLNNPWMVAKMNSSLRTTPLKTIGQPSGTRSSRENSPRKQTKQLVTIPKERSMREFMTKINNIPISSSLGTIPIGTETYRLRVKCESSISQVLYMFRVFQQCDEFYYKQYPNAIREIDKDDIRQVITKLSKDNNNLTSVVAKMGVKTSDNGQLNVFCLI
ncbi:histidine kinase-like ATPase [Lipomyces arxii]|uniref:histidine kinase-like ATPase n=1 Tax=Lipomyces arxii TaxID=56418 RepID=UPI0034CF003A